MINSFDLIRWSKLYPLVDNRIAKLSIVIPVIGYAILMNDHIANNISFNVITSNNKTYINTGLRLRLWYFGFTFLALAHLVYYIARPYTVAISQDSRGFVREYFNIVTNIDLDRIINRILQKKYVNPDLDELIVKNTTFQISDIFDGRLEKL